MPKLFPCFGLSRRADLSAIVASSIAREITARSRGFTISSSERRDPNIIWNCESGMTANSSWVCPRNEPRFSLMPTTRKWTPSI